MTNVFTYDSDPDNITQVGGVGMVGGIAKVPAIDNSLRGLASEITRGFRDLFGDNTLGGGADALTITTNTTGLSSYSAKFILGGIAASSNTTTTPTLAVDGGSAIVIKKAIEGAETTLAIGDIKAGGFYAFKWRSDWNTTGCWQLLDLNNFSRVSGPVFYSGEITPAQITSNQNDYAPTGFSTASILRLSSDATRGITGFSGGTDGRVIFVFNIGSQVIFFDEDSGSSSVGNRIYTPGGETFGLIANTGCFLLYDGTSSHWRIIPPGLERAGQSTQETASSITTVVTPGRQHYHPSAAKCWGQTTGAGTPSLTTSYNVTSITDTAAGKLTVTIATDFSSANWAGVAICVLTDVQTESHVILTTKAAGSVLITRTNATPVYGDPDVGFDWVFFGDQ